MSRFEGNPALAYLRKLLLSVEPASLAMKNVGQLRDCTASLFRGPFPHFIFLSFPFGRNGNVSRRKGLLVWRAPLGWVFHLISCTYRDPEYTEESGLSPCFKETTSVYPRLDDFLCHRSRFSLSKST